MQIHFFSVLFISRYFIGNGDFSDILCESLKLENFDRRN